MNHDPPVIRYSVITIFLLLVAFVIQQFIPAFTGLYDSRIHLVQLVFLCCAVTVGPPTMLLLAFIGGFLWDAHCALGPQGGDPEVYTQQVEALRFGYSILLFGGMGFLMQGIQPLFKQGKWQFSAVLSGIAVFLYLAAEYAIINFVRGEFLLTRPTVLQMIDSSILTMLVSPIVFWLLYRIAKACDHSIYPEAGRRRRAY
jgi:cell shape-determining protein MreD